MVVDVIHIFKEKPCTFRRAEGLESEEEEFRMGTVSHGSRHDHDVLKHFMTFNWTPKIFLLPSCYFGCITVYYWVICKIFQIPDFSYQDNTSPKSRTLHSNVPSQVRILTAGKTATDRNTWSSAAEETNGDTSTANVFRELLFVGG